MATARQCFIIVLMRTPLKGQFMQQYGMQHSVRRLLRLFMVASFTVGCSDFGVRDECLDGKCPEKSGSTVRSERALAPKRDQQRHMLNEGYSMLYADAGKLDLAKYILYAKNESDATDKMVTTITVYAGKLKKDLERVARDYPAVRIDLEPLPEIESRKRFALAKDRVLYFAPIVGHSGREYERTMLISFANGLNHQRYLCQVMAEQEPDAGLKKFLETNQQRYSELYDSTITLLNEEYFSDPNGKSKN